MADACEKLCLIFDVFLKKEKLNILHLRIKNKFTVLIMKRLRVNIKILRKEFDRLTRLFKLKRGRS